MNNSQLIVDFAAYLQRTKPTKGTPLRVSAERFADTVAFENTRTYENSDLYGDLDFVQTNHFIYPRVYEYDGSICEATNGCCATFSATPECKCWYHVVQFI